MEGYRAIVHYYFKKGMEESGLKFIENELVKKAKSMGCHGVELWQNEKDHSQFVGIGYWNSIEEARLFQSHWESKEKELLKFCIKAPHHEFFKVRTTYSEKSKRAA